MRRNIMATLLVVLVLSVVLNASYTQAAPVAKSSYQGTVVEIYQVRDIYYIVAYQYPKTLYSLNGRAYLTMPPIKTVFIYYPYSHTVRFYFATVDPVVHMFNSIHEAQNAIFRDTPRAAFELLIPTDPKSEIINEAIEKATGIPVGDIKTAYDIIKIHTRLSLIAWNLMDATRRMISYEGIVGFTRNTVIFWVGNHPWLIESNPQIAAEELAREIHNSIPSYLLD
jgi:hypothetical protein